ncbi:ice-binding family protein [Streptosporangium sp. NBC_01495]|uniref:ice-binding family protein n=1 Tax=Streptosporangium sp. NBC_01495 TaxID=2903899 RepID=UPI002E2F5FF1|nr:ice-binding family protein [Streptosporangium sp. NBC_01495]
MTGIGHSHIAPRSTVRSWLTGALTVAVALGCAAAIPHPASAAQAVNTAGTAHEMNATNTGPGTNEATPVPLGTATNFAVLAGTRVADTGATVVTGELGVSPGTAATGFPPGVVAGAVYTADSVAAQAQADLATAYDNAVRRPGTASLPAQLGGLTVKPGVYNPVSGAFQIAGELTLDGQGNPNAVFVLRAPGLVTAPASAVRLANGAQACNVFWQVGGSATLGANSNFVGNVLALNSITAADGATVNGRLLAREGTVNLDGATVTRSACAVVPSRQTSTKLAAFCDPEAPGHLTLVANVTSSGAAPLAGPVEFFANGVSQDKSQSDDGGRASLTVSHVPTRTHEFVAAFAGTNRLDPSTSPVLTVPVGPKGVCQAPPASPATAGDTAGADNKNKNNRGPVTYPPKKKAFKGRNSERHRHHHPRFRHHRHQR